MLTGKQKRFLRSEAHHLSALFQVGKGGVNEHLIKHIEVAIETRELIKICILQNCEDDKQEIADQLAKETKSYLVQLIGLTVVLYKPSKNNKKIVLPTKG